MAQKLALIVLILGLAFGSASFAAANGPGWTELSPQHRQTLEPLKNEWASFDAQRKQKWLEIARRYPEMSLYAQWQLRNRMQEWARLTPEQRRAARERYKEFEQLPPEQRETVREQYERKKMEEDSKAAAQP